MIQLDNVDKLMRNLSTLKETSKDYHDGSVVYMTESEIPVIDFDAVKDDYIRDMHLSEAPKSNDALFIGTDDDLFFIEFKNGKMDKEIYSVRLKIFDSLLVFLDIVNATASFTRAHMTYILVYNESANSISPSRTKIAKHYIEKKAKKKFMRFDLERFEKLYFKEVYTYTQAEFKENFEEKYASLGTGV